MTTRLPCAVPLTTREIADSPLGSNFFTDTVLINCMVEKSPEGKLFVNRRPGLLTTYTYGGGGALTTQGIYNYKDVILFSVAGNTLYNAAGVSVNVAATGAAWTANTLPPWANRRDFGCSIFNGQIFVTGGLDATGFVRYNDVWSSSDGVNWTQIISAAPWGARYGHQTVVLGNTMYLIGGNNNGTLTNDVWSTADGVNWTLVTGAAAWAARSGHGAVIFNQGIFIMGGVTTGGGYLNDVWFSPDGSTWTEMISAAAWSAREEFGCIVYNGKIWVFGGYTGAVVGTVYSSPDGITWTNTGSMPATRYSPAICVYANTIFLLGGFTGAGGTTTVWSTTDGASFTVVTATYGGAAIYGAALVPFRTPASINALQPYTMFQIGGSPAGIAYYATLNVNLFSSQALPGASGTDAYQFDTQNAGDYLIIKNNEAAYVFWAGLVTRITSTNYPLLTVPGVVNLDDTVYVMDINGVIYGTDLSNPFSISALNFITADFASDVGVCIVKYLQYVLALKSTTFQLFYDAGRYPGSPLLPILNANTKVGCASAQSVVKMINTVVFMAQTEALGRYVVVMDGYTAKPISNPDVNRILNAWDAAGPVYSIGSKFNGHDLYILTYMNSGGSKVTLVYDFAEDWWYIWQGVDTAVFPGIFYSKFQGNDYVQDRTRGIIYNIAMDNFGDDSANIAVSGQLSIIDGGNNYRKFETSLSVIGDRLAASAPNNVTIYVSDDDNQNFTNCGTYDLTQPYNPITRLGSFYRRSHKFAHADKANPFRIEALEVELAGSQVTGG